MSYILAIAGGYALAIFTWGRVKVWINGVEAEAAALKAKAKDLLSKV